MVANVSELMNLARPKSETLINRDNGSLFEYKIFSGYVITIRITTTYFNVSMNNIQGMTIIDRVDNGANCLTRFFFSVLLLGQNVIKQLQVIYYVN